MAFGSYKWLVKPNSCQQIYLTNPTNWEKSNYVVYQHITYLPKIPTTHKVHVVFSPNSVEKNSGFSWNIEIQEFSKKKKTETLSFDLIKSLTERK